MNEGEVEEAWGCIQAGWSAFALLGNRQTAICDHEATAPATKEAYHHKEEAYDSISHYNHMHNPSRITAAATHVKI